MAASNVICVVQIIYFNLECFHSLNSFISAFRQKNTEEKLIALGVEAYKPLLRKNETLKRLPVVARVRGEPPDYILHMPVFRFIDDVYKNYLDNIPDEKARKRYYKFYTAEKNRYIR